MKLFQKKKKTKLNKKQISREKKSGFVVSELVALIS
jgi:hypothetical protein